MRRILKTQADSHLQREQERVVPASAREASTRWHRYDKAATNAFLLDEQWGLCAYTELALEGFQYGCHIEHIEPKSINPARTFDYHNLAISALDSESLTKFAKKDRFGGHYKQNVYDPNLFVSPVMPDSERYFDYLSSGRVEPAQNLTPEDRAKAIYTRDLLNLNAPFLVNSRRKWLMELEDEIDRLLDDEPALKQLAECELCDTNGRLREFHGAAKARFGRLGAQIMATFCAPCR
jgi:uncharacterized protein (TIGR02646 family)